MSQEVVEKLLSRWGDGDRQALDALVDVAYRELHRTARKLLAGEAPGARTRPTSLVHDLYLELTRQGTLRLADGEHFLRIAAYLMRQILVARARRRGRSKREGGRARVPWSECVERELHVEPALEQVLAVDAALSRLEEIDPLKARIAELRYFGDLSLEETARALNLSSATVKRHWAVARLWLARNLRLQGDSAA